MATEIASNNVIAYSSFGEANTTFGNGFSGRSVLYGERYAELDRRESYYMCRQHDSKIYDFDGRVSSPRSMQPMLGAEKAPFYVPHRQRRPSSPYRLGPIIVNSFTNILFGENRFPTIRMDGDSKSEDFVQTVSRTGRLPLKMIQARNLGGSMGTVGMSWCYQDGKPRFEVHNAKNLFVHSWEDRLALLPRHISEVYLFYKIQWDGKQFAKIYYWFRKDWTRDADILFKPVPFQEKGEPIWIPDLEKSVVHKDGLNHFTWMQNLPSDEIDGVSDYDGLLDSFDSIDILKSVIVRGATLNLDPTLKVKMDPDLVNRMGIRKGSDNALIVGTDGDADYLELGGQSIEAGIKLLETMRRAILETAQCVVPDPHEVAAQGVSSVAQKMMFAPMTSKGDVLREQYGAGMERLLDGPVTIARKASKSSIVMVDPVTDQPVLDEVTGQPKVGEFFVDLPPRIVMGPPVDEETGMPVVDPATGDPLPDVAHKIQRMPGEGGELSLRWPPYFTPTPDDQSKVVTTMSVAAGGQAVISNQTASEIVAGAFGVDPAEEKRRMEKEHKDHQNDQAGMFPSGAGGEVGHRDELPPGAAPKAPKAPLPPQPQGKPTDDDYEREGLNAGY